MDRKIGTVKSLILLGFMLKAKTHHQRIPTVFQKRELTNVCASLYFGVSYKVALKLSLVLSLDLSRDF